MEEDDLKKRHVAAQTMAVYRMEGKNWARHVYYGEKECGDCKVKSGMLHIPGCDAEPCPKCRGQFITCNCDKSTLRGKSDEQLHREIHRHMDDIISVMTVQLEMLITWASSIDPAGFEHVCATYKNIIESNRTKLSSQQKEMFVIFLNEAFVQLEEIKKQKGLVVDKKKLH